MAFTGHINLYGGNEKSSFWLIIKTSFSRFPVVEISGIEPLTSWMPFKRSPSWAIPPDISRYGILGEPLLNCRTASGFGTHLGVRKCVVRAPSWAIPPCAETPWFSTVFRFVITFFAVLLWCCSPDDVPSRINYVEPQIMLNQHFVG